MKTRQPGFFGSLFDLKFNNYVTSRIVRGAYRLTIVLTVNATMFWWLMAYELPWWMGWEIKLTIFALAPTSAIIGLAITRIALEYLIVIFQIDEKLTVIAEHTRKDEEITATGTLESSKLQERDRAAPDDYEKTREKLIEVIDDRGEITTEEWPV